MIVPHPRRSSIYFSYVVASILKDVNEFYRWRKARAISNKNTRSDANYWYPHAVDF